MSEAQASERTPDAAPAPSEQAPEAFGRVRHASEFKCCDCKTAQAVVFWPACDPDIQSYPYCRKCVDAAKMNLIISIYAPDHPSLKARKKPKKDGKANNGKKPGS